MDELDFARRTAWARIVFGTAFVLAPAKISKAWMGHDVDSVYTRMAGRSLGARDLAIGIGLLSALNRGAPVGGWLQAGALSDGVDAFSALVGVKRLSTARSLFFLGTAGASAYLGLKAANSLD
jgi:hypothetical protein